MQGYRSSREHVFEELRCLDLQLNRQIIRQRSDPAYAGFTEFRGLFIADNEIDLLMGNQHSSSASDVDADSGLDMVISAIEQLEDHIRSRTKASQEQGFDLALPRLAQMFDLTPFDLGVLLVCLAPELDLKYQKLYAYLQNDVTRKQPSMALILNVFCHSLEEKLEARSRLLAEAPLLRHLLIAYTNDAPNGPQTLLSRALKIDDRILHYLLDIEALDEPLLPFTRLVAPCAYLEDLLLPAELQENLVRCFRSEVAPTNRHAQAGARVFLFQGPAGVGKKFTAEALCQSAGMPLLVADVPRMLANGAALAPLAQRLFREASLQASAVYLDGAETLLAESDKAVDAKRALLEALDEGSSITFIGTQQPWDAHSDGATAMSFKVVFPMPPYTLRRQLWRKFLLQGGERIELGADFDTLVDQFHFTAGEIHAAITEAKHLALMRGADTDELAVGDLFQACRGRGSAKLITLARRITPLYTWQDIILPADRLEHLREICAHVRYRQQVFEGWGFDRKLSLGKGLSVLFVGPSGTGKTMAAEIIAGALRLDLYKVDLSCVVSKYIGETEKNLSRIFREAEQGDAVLFFDEADAIFGKRSEVRDSHDRYANIETNYLLQKLEEHEGMVILASNFQKNMDDAFTRRMRFIVEFPFPDEAYRYRIWESVFPDDLPLGANLDFEFHARKFKMTGGNIKNIALAAAFLAAEDSGVVTMEHIIRATKRELQKMGRLCVKADFEQYFDLVKNEEVMP